MHITELDSFKLSDAVKFHNRLNPKIWGRDEQLLPEVREKLMAIADNFREFLGVGDLDVKDITISGSNAAYSYTPYSDIDLHLVVEFPADDEVYQELFNAKKYQYNDEHKLSIGGVPVELYVQNAAESPVSQGEYSISRGEWIQVPRRKRARIDDTCVRAKVEDLDARIHSAIESGNAESMSRLWHKIKTMRQSGLDTHGEFGCENIVFKILRNKGCIKDLRTARTAAQDHELSLQERRKKKSRVRYGFGSYWAPGFGYGGESGEGGGDGGGGGESMREGHQGQPYSSPDGVAANTQMFLNEDDTESMVKQFIQDTAERLGIERMPEIQLHADDGWSEQNHSFGMYQPELHVLHVNLGNRHVMDILRTVAHELAHCRQQELEPLDANAGATGSPVENEANAVAGIIMRDFADAHPELFDHEDIRESSGYIPTKAQAKDPRFVMALTTDVRPGATGLNANRMALRTDSQGRPQLLKANGRVDVPKSESIIEIFEPGKQNWKWRRQSSDEAFASFIVGDREYQWHAFSSEANPVKWEIQFRLMRGPDDPDDLDLFGQTGTGNSAQVLSTAVDITRAFLQTYGIDKVEEITFNAKEDSRIDLYAKMIKRLLPTWELSNRKSQSHGMQFTLTDPRAYDKPENKIAQGVAEDAVLADKKLVDYQGLKISLQAKNHTVAVDAFDAAGAKQVGQVVFDIDDNGQLEGADLEVAEKYRGQGVAKTMYDFVKAQGYTINRSWSQTAAGADFWDKNRGQERVWEDQDDLVESLSREFALFEEQDLFEINMGSKSLRREAARTGAIAGMEFEMIVPNVEGGSDNEDLEPDYEYDQRCRSIQDAYDFFYDGDFNSRRRCDEMRDSMRNDYTEWLDEKIETDWNRSGEEYMGDWVLNNVDESEWNPDELEGDDRNQALEEYATNAHAYPASDQYQTAYEEFREENQESYDESDWLDDVDLDVMSEIGNSYSMDWPHWSSPGSGGEAEISDVAQDFENAIGRDVRASTGYHSDSVIRPSPTQIRYVVEPDGSLDGENPGDRGLEFVSPPLPIDEILSDLNKVRAWAKEYGCYTNDSTGLHINISVPDYSLDRLDYVKLALLLGDEYVLNQFGRSSNIYTKSALGKVRDRVRSNPEEAQQLLDKMKGQMGELASKAIHSGSTEKFTSINTKDGHIEFRSPGGDWLDDNFDKIENTLLRFTVAMSAALDPEAYREEYQKKLYKLLTQDQKGSDTIRYFADYVAGKIPKAALRSFVKQAQLERNVKRGETSNQKMWWSVTNPPQSSAGIEVVATSREEAIEKALGQDGYPSWANTRQSVVAKPLRPYEQSAKTVRYEIYNKETGNSVEDADGITNDEEALIRLNDYIEHGPHSLQRGQATAMFGIRTTGGVEIVDIDIPMAQGRAATSPTGKWKIIDGLGRYLFVFIPANNTRTAANELAAVWARENNFDGNYQVEPVVDTAPTRTRDQQQGGLIDIEPDIEVVYPGSTAALAQQQATPGTFSGAWKVMVNGEEVHRFSGVGNSQSDANRVAATWLRNNGRGVSGEGFEVYPIMTEDLAEGRKYNFGDFAVTLGPHAIDRTIDRQVDPLSVEQILQNINQVRSSIMGQPVGAAFILHDGKSTALGIRRHDNNRLTLATVYPIRSGFTKGKHPTFRVDVDSMAEGRDQYGNFVAPYNIGENFADGRNPQDKGDSKRHGVPTKASISTLRKVAKPVAEARSKPDQNTKPESGMKELQAVAKTIMDPENWAISMTAEPKLGINPQVGISEDTPKGIYFYPLNYALDLVQRRKTLPWGDNMPYIQLFQYDRSGEMTKETSVDSAQLKQALLQYCPKEVIQSAIDEPEYDGTPYWFIYDCLSRLGKSDETNIVRWNKVLRDLGFTSVFDDGHGWIAYNEPTQGVVLDPRIIKQHKTISNKKQSRVVTPAAIEQAIFDTLDIELAANRAWQAYDPTGSKLRAAAKEYAKKPEFKQYYGKPGSEEIFDKAASWGRYGARELSQEAYEWFKAQQAQTVAENFADGRNPQDKGDSKRHGVPTKASVSTLRKVAKQGGRKGQLAHWAANMKAGRARAKRNK